MWRRQKTRRLRGSSRRVKCLAEPIQVRGPDRAIRGLSQEPTFTGSTRLWASPNTMAMRKVSVTALSGSKEKTRKR
jgi:hypothetical protein